MVGKRQHTFDGTNRRPSFNPSSSFRNGDLENGDSFKSPTRTRFGFKDAVNYTVAQERRDELKKALEDGIDFVEPKKYYKSKDDLKAIKNKGVRKFYETQNQRLNDWYEIDNLVNELCGDVIESFNPDADHDGIMERRGPLHESGEEISRFLPEDQREKMASDARKGKWAINVNVIANVLILVVKVIAVFSTGSLSLLASTLDSALDLLCTMIVWTTNRLVQWRLSKLQAKFPVGRRRLEPIGILVFSIIMVVSFLQVLQESVQKLMPSGDHSTAPLPVIAIAAMAGNAVVKGIIGIGCYPIKTTQVQALVQDCKTDVYFNTASLLFPLIGYHIDVWWLDPLGAALLSVYIVYDWADTCMENITRLTGAAVPDCTWQKLLMLAWRFSPVVDGYKTMTAYHAGDGVWVEFDLIFDENTPLHRAHDVAETLQYCAEGLPEVDRAFVTVDYAIQGPSGHAAESSGHDSG